LDCIQEIEIQSRTGNPDRDARVTLNKHQLNVRVRQNHRIKEGEKSHKNHGQTDSSLWALWLLQGTLRSSQALMDEWQNTTTSDSSSHERVEFFVSPNRKLQVPWRDALDTKILRRIACPRKQS
jgi:hypothetical protein